MKAFTKDQKTNRKVKNMTKEIWKIERRPGAFASDPCYYVVRFRGVFIMAFDKKKDAKEFIEMYGKPMEEFAFKWEEKNDVQG
nr:hypothetical protein YKEOBPQY_YKEOBPQY_CDS_0006 [Microvirus sp.]